jgi:serine/threonine-protein kinase
VREIFERLTEASRGRYDITRELGRGGMALVFLGYQQSLERQIAIKVLLPFLAYDTELVERFLREARTQGKLDHPSIIKVYEVHSEGGLTFFTMPYVSGRSLRTLLLDDPQPPLTQVKRYLCQAADALAYAHRRGVIHRDVKPDNMVLDEERDCVIITDFGIAKALAAETTLTTPGDLLGTPQYMSPEQGEGRQDLDGRADQYSLGLIAYEMIAGRRPFQADNLAELMYKHRFEEPETLDILRPDVPWSLRLAVMRAISKDREDRFPTMEGFHSALEACAPELEAIGEDRTEPMPPPGSGDTTLRVPTPTGRTPTPRTPPGRTPIPPARTPTPPARTPTPPAGTPTPWARTPTPPPSSGTPAPPGITPTPPGRTPTPPGRTPTPPGRTPTPPSRTPTPPPGFEPTAPGRTPTPPGRTPTPPGRTPTPPSRTPTPPSEMPTEITPPPPGRTPTPPARTPTPPPESAVLRSLDETTPATWSTPDVDVSWDSAVAPTVTPQPAAPAFPSAVPVQPRRRRTRAVLLSGMGIAAAAAVTALFVWGPLKPLLERSGTSETLDPGSITGLVELPPEEQPPTVTEGLPPDEPATAGESETQVAGVTGQEAGGEEGPGAAGGETETLPVEQGPTAAEREAEAAAALAAVRGAAESARGQARTARSQARSASAAEIFESEYADLAARMQSADRAMNAQQYETASTRYSTAARGFSSLAQRSSTAVSEGALDALAARRAMEQQRDSALSAGARENAPQGLVGANMVASQARDEFAGGNYQNATDLYQNAAELYAGVLVALTTRVVEETTPTEQQTPDSVAAAAEQTPDSAAAAEEEEPPPEEETVVEVPPEELIGGLVERFRVLFENEDRGAMARELYRAAIPGNDARILNAVFERADDIQITSFERQVEVDGYSARADVRLHFDFRQSTTRETRDWDLRLRLHFAAVGPGDWQLRRLEQR